MHLHSSRTDFQMAQLAGAMSLDGDDLTIRCRHAGQLPSLRSKDIQSAPCHRARCGSMTPNGRVEVTALNPVGTMNIENRNGSVQLTLPANAKFSVQATPSTAKSIPTSTSVDQNGNDHSIASGSVGGGGPLIHIMAEKGDITLHRNQGSSDSTNQHHLRGYERVDGASTQTGEHFAALGNKSFPAAATPLRVVFFTWYMAASAARMIGMNIQAVLGKAGHSEAGADAQIQSGLRQKTWWCAAFHQPIAPGPGPAAWIDAASARQIHRRHSDMPVSIRPRLSRTIWPTSASSSAAVQMSMGIIDPLEIIQIEEDQADRLARAPAALEGMLQPVVQMASVVQAGAVVGDGQLLDLFECSCILDSDGCVVAQGVQKKYLVVVHAFRMAIDQLQYAVGVVSHAQRKTDDRLDAVRYFPGVRPRAPDLPERWAGSSARHAAPPSRECLGPAECACGAAFPFARRR